MLGAIVGFDWDAGNGDKCQKHGVTIAEVEAFLMGTPRIAPDYRHSGREQRYLAVGRNEVGRAMFVAFTIRIRDGKQFVRPISARYMHAKEIKGYEEKSPPFQNR
jgi:uncharacterized DUF497 family protein